MLSNSPAIATIAVTDLRQAAHFYGRQLGLQVDSTEGDEVIIYKTGGARLNVYRSAVAGSNKATVATWSVGESIDEVVRSLRERGVVFEHYDLPGMTCEGDVHLGGDMRVAWFKDPDGNLLSLVSR